MTTQTPFDPAAPFPAYPTAAPWAPPQPPGPPADHGPHTRHGQLMVAYPELMHRAGRPKPPSWIPVVLVTLLVGMVGALGGAVGATVLFGAGRGFVLGWGCAFAFALFGAIPAARRGTAARQDRNAGYPYWLAFGLTYAGAALLSVITVSVAVPKYLAFHESVVTNAVQSSVVHDGKIKTGDGVSVQSAQCTPTGSRGSDGTRPYRCDVSLSNGTTGTVRVVADGRGNWTAVKSR